MNKEDKKKIIKEIKDELNINEYIKEIIKSKEIKDILFNEFEERLSNIYIKEEKNNNVKEYFIDFPQNTPLSEIEPAIESKYLFEESMNGGKYGTSMKIRDKISKKLYRIKILHKTSLLKFKRISNVIKYYKNMMILNNKFVNKIIEVYQNCDNSR